MIIIQLAVFIFGIYSIINAFNGYYVVLKISTILSCIYCLKSSSYAFPPVTAISLRLSIILFSIFCALVNRLLIHLQIPHIGWLIANSLFILLSFFTLLSVIQDKYDDYKFSQTKTRGH